jgi:DNA-binding IclR family transcriptional regulator
MTQATTQLVPAVDRAIRMLTNLRHDKDGKGISDLARDLGIPKSSAFQIAATLVHHGLLECDGESRRYRLGLALAGLAGDRRARADLPVLAAPHLAGLAAASGLTALLGIPAAAGTVLAARGDSPEQLGISAPVGFRLDAQAGAFGKVFAAEREGEALARFLRCLPRYTARSITDATVYRRDLERVRERGYATDFEEYIDGVRALAAPVRDGRGVAVAAVCVLGVVAKLKRTTMRATVAQLLGVASALSRDLGYVDPVAGEAS